MIHIRPATIVDAPVIALLGRTTFQETFGSLFRDQGDLRAYLNDTFSVKKIERSLDKANNAFWLAFVDALPVGYAKLKLRSPTPFMVSTEVGQLQKIYVLHEFLSMKIGKRLQDILVEAASQSGSNAVWLSVLKSNARAIRFYQKNEFNHVGAHQFVIGKETFEFLVMAKQF